MVTNTTNMSASTTVQPFQSSSSNNSQLPRRSPRKHGVSLTFNPSSGWVTKLRPHRALPSISSPATLDVPIIRTTSLSISPTLGFETQSTSAIPTVLSPSTLIITRTSSQPTCFKRLRDTSDNNDDYEIIDDSSVDEEIIDDQYSINSEDHYNVNGNGDDDDDDNEIMSIIEQPRSILVSPLPHKRRHRPPPPSPCDSASQQSSPAKIQFINYRIQNNYDSNDYNNNQTSSASPSSSSSSITTLSVRRSPRIAQLKYSIPHIPQVRSIKKLIDNEFTATTPSPLTNPVTRSQSLITSRTSSQWKRFKTNHSDDTISEYISSDPIIPISSSPFSSQSVPVLNFVRKTRSTPIKRQSRIFDFFPQIGHHV